MPNRKGCPMKRQFTFIESDNRVLVIDVDPPIPGQPSNARIRVFVEESRVVLEASQIEAARAAFSVEPAELAQAGADFGDDIAAARAVLAAGRGLTADEAARFRGALERYQQDGDRVCLGTLKAILAEIDRAPAVQATPIRPRAAKGRG